MTREIRTVSDAAHDWVREMDAIQQSMIDKLMGLDPDDWHEVTTPSKGDRVYVYNVEGKSKDHEGYIKGYDEEADLYAIELDNGKLLSCEGEDFEVEYDGSLPMWGTMWSFRDSADVWWLEEDDGIRKMSECGFRVYESEEFGYFFGIDGAGYDFYGSHWIPLYRARGLQWHDEETEKEAS